MNSIVRRIFTSMAMAAIVSGICVALDAPHYVSLSISLGIGLLIGITPGPKDKQ